MSSILRECHKFVECSNWETHHECPAWWEALFILYIKHVFYSWVESLPDGAESLQCIPAPLSGVLNGEAPVAVWTKFAYWDELFLPVTSSLYHDGIKHLNLNWSNETGWNYRYGRHSAFQSPNTLLAYPLMSMERRLCRMTKTTNKKRSSLLCTLCERGRHWHGFLAFPTLSTNLERCFGHWCTH